VLKDLTVEDERQIFLGEVRREGSQLVTSGIYGWTLVATGTGQRIAEARRAVYERLRKVHIPRARYRTDIGLALETSDEAYLESLGVFDSRDN
jgi:phosphoribosylamine-glycine ligase